MFDKASQPFQDFSILMTVRNSLMHPKPLDRFDDSGRVMVPPSFMRDFEQRRMTYERDADTSVSWLNLLETEKVASWACRAAIEIIVSVINLAPANPLIEMWGGFFSGHYKTWAHQP
jgi:hypothetical protein